MKKRRTARRLLAVLLALSLALSLLPVTAMAEGLEDEEGSLMQNDFADPDGTQNDPEETPDPADTTPPEETPTPEEGEYDSPQEDEDGVKDENETPTQEPAQSPANYDIALISDEGYTQVTDVAEITSGGQFVLVAQNGEDYYALGTAIASKITATPVTITNGVVSADTELPVWTLAPLNDGVSLSNGTDYLSYNGSTNFNGVSSEFEWDVTGSSGTFCFTANSAETRAIAYDNATTTTQRFGAYLTSSTYIFNLLVFKGGDYEETKVATPKATPASGSRVEAGATVALSCGTKDATIQVSTNQTDWENVTNGEITIPSNLNAGDTYTIYVKAIKDGLDPSDVLTLTYTIYDPAAVSSIAQARAGSAGDVFTVSGVVTCDVGNGNVYIQDETGGICLYKSGLTAEVGKQVTATGTWTNYSGLLELANPTITVVGDGTLPQPKAYTIAEALKVTAVTSADQGIRVKITDAKVTAISTSNVTISDGTNTINIYKCPTVEDLAVGATIDVVAVVSTNSNKGQLLVASASDITVTEKAPEQPEQPPEELYKPADGDKVVIYHASSGVTISSTLSGTRLVGVASKESGVVLTVSVRKDGENEFYTFTAEDGKCLATGTTGGNLTLEAPGTEGKVTEWVLEEKSNGWNIYGNGAVASNKNQYIELYQSNFTTYGYSTSTEDIFLLKFYDASNFRIIDWTVDNEVEQTIAQWGGALKKYEDANGADISSTVAYIYGDKINVGDELDASSKFEVFVGGSAIKPLAASTKPSYYMGGEGLKAGDYAQFTTSSLGWGGMTLSLRIRATAAASANWTVQYSVDGVTFSNFGTGSWSTSGTTYSGDGSTSPTTKEGTITDGVIPASQGYIGSTANYVTVTLDVPVGAENAEHLYIRLVGGDTAVNGSSTANGNVRIDTVKLVGSPVVSDKVTAYVQVDPDNSDEVGSGTTIKLTSEAGATIYYGWANNATGEVTYTAGNTTVVPGTLPATLFVKAQAAGKAESVTRVLTYLPASVASVRMDPNGGGVYTGAGPVEVTLSTATEGATIYYTRSDWPKVENANGEYVDKYEVYDGTTHITLSTGFGSLTVSAYAEKEGFTTSAITTREFTDRSTETYQLFFGQMHSHTSYSDGAGTAEQAFSSVKALDKAVWNMDFVSVTDHSNSFDDAGGAKRLNDVPTGEEWNEGKALAAKYTDSSFVGIFGYEMTWSNGLGHINTFNTAGYQDRTQSSYTTFSTALQNYYAELKTAPASISQFNHPGTTFGDFSDFSYFDEEIDQLITLIEVGNGEGAIGSSGYFPSYEYYTRALDKGWHVAPTNNQDNHKGAWGTANTGRDVVLVDELTEEAIYDAMRNYRVYATEDLNLEIYYEFDGNIMGTILDADTYGAGEKATITVKLSDKDDTGTATIEVIVNGGVVAASTKATCNETVTFEVPTIYSYYYIKVTQADKDIAVTAPVWVGKVEAVGVGNMATTSDLTVVGREQGITLELYNNENSKLEVSSVELAQKFVAEDGTITYKTLQTRYDITSVNKLSTAATSFTCQFDTDGIVTVTAIVRGRLNGVDKTYTQDLELKVMPTNVLGKIIVDGSHYNDYVTGYYGAGATQMSNMTAIAATVGVDVIIKTDTITKEDLADCGMLVISSPARKNGTYTATGGTYIQSMYEESFLETVKWYVEQGGIVVVCGLADYQDNNAPAEYHGAAQQNRLLSYIGSTMKINDDEAYESDTAYRGGELYRLYPITFNTASSWCKGIMTAEIIESMGLSDIYTTPQSYSQYSGCTIDPGKGTWLVGGQESTYSVDSDKDGVGATDEIETDDSYKYNIVTPKGEAYFMACEQIGDKGGVVFVAGGVFLSNYEVKADIDDYALPYANRTIYENMLSAVRGSTTITPIADTRTADLNRIFTIEGYVTAGTTYKGTTFFDSIYVQDSTGGTDVFPYATEGLAIGTKVRVLGYTDAYQGDRELQVINLEVLDDAPYIYQPRQLTTAQAADYGIYGGQLVSTTGVVSEIVYVEGIVSQFRLTDSTGVPATVFIDGYITSASGPNTIGSWIKNGQTVSAVGLLYSHPEGSSDVSVPVLRVRNCDEVKLASDVPSVPDIPVGPVVPSTPSTPSTPGTSGGSSGSSGSDTSGGNTDNSVDQPAEPAGPVTTGSNTSSGTVVTETTAVIESKSEGSSASATVSKEIGQEIVDQTVRNNSDTVVIAPDMSSGVTEAEVSIPSDIVAEIKQKSDANVRVETPVATVTIPNEGLSGLAAAGGNVTVSAAQSGNTLAVTITANGNQVNNVAGGVTVTVPQTNCGPGTVAMLVNEDGTTEVIRQSIASGDGRSITVPLDGSATIVIADNSVPLSDVPATNWAADAVAFVSSHELMQGTGNGAFEPNASMTRGMLATVLHNLENNPIVASSVSFTDVADSAWYADAVAWASSKGIITGYTDGSFGANDPITREQLAVMLYRYAGSPAVNASALNFVDAGDVSSYAQTAIAWAVANGILNGKGNGVLDPQGTATRAEVAQMLLNFVSSMA